MSEFHLIHDDCLAAMSCMAEASVDAVVCDPPYGLSFMGKKWDYDVPAVAVWKECYRVLTPGARLLAFAGTRTMHRMWCNIEDAGFTIEDTIAWIYGSGFPKHDSKLKPAYEPVCVARKGPVSELNIDACRIGVSRPPTTAKDFASWRRAEGRTDSQIARPDTDTEKGRWPANVVLDDEAAKLLDLQSGNLTSGFMAAGTQREGIGYHGALGNTVRNDTHGDSGGASRFFYCAKADRSERDFGLEGASRKPGGSNAKGFTEDVARGQDRNRQVANHHPTVKPVDLMRWLVRLVTPQGGVVLDPFTGSGTTGVACVLEGFRFIGIEREAEYIEIASKRIGNSQPSLFAS